VSRMILVCVVQRPGACPSDGPNAGTFSTSGQSTDCCSPRRPDANSLRGIDVAFVSDPAPRIAWMALSSD